MNEKGKALAAGAAAFLVSLSVWSLIYDVVGFPHEALLAVRGEEMLALSRLDGTPLPEILERMKTAGATAVLVRDQTWAEAAAEGRVHYFPKGQAAALRALGLLDPTAPFPEDSLWLPEGEGPAPASRLLRDSGVRFTTATFNGRAVLRFAEGLDLERLRAGPSPFLIAAARSAELLPVYALERWDKNAAAIVDSAVDRPDFPRVAYAALGPRDAQRFVEGAQRRVMDEGLFLPPGPRGLAARVKAWTAADLPAGVPIERVKPALEDARPRLVVQAVDPKMGLENALLFVRQAAELMGREGMQRTGTPQDFRDTEGAPPAIAWLRRSAVLLLSLVLPVVCLLAGSRALARALESHRWPLAAPVWQLAAGYGAAAGAALAAGVLLDGLLSIQRPLFARLLLYAPFFLGAAWWYRQKRPALGRRLERPLTVLGLLGLVAGAVAAWGLWGLAATHPLASAALMPHWRSICVGGPAALLAFWVRCRRHAGLRGVFEDERPLLLLGLWLPVEMVGAFILSSAPFWVNAERALVFAASGFFVGAVLLAGLSYYELRIRPWAIHSRWIA